MHFLVPGALDRPTGGSRYDQAIIGALKAAGQSVNLVELTGTFPGPDATAAQAVSDALTRIPAGSLVVVDGLVLGGLPESFAPHASRLHFIALVHHPLCLENGLPPQQADTLQRLECQALKLCQTVIATSDHTREQLQTLSIYPGPIAVVEPGCEAGPISAGSQTSETAFICVGSITPRKGQDLLIKALARLPPDTPPWHCHLIGSMELAPPFAEAVASQIMRSGLANEVTLHGPLSAAALTRAYTTADCLILPSRYEGYGMVINEAIAHGLPVITTTAGALADTLPPAAGLAVPPEDAAALQQAIQRFLKDSTLQQQLRTGARNARENLTPWSLRGEQFNAALNRMKAR